MDTSTVTSLIAVGISIIAGTISLTIFFVRKSFQTEQLNKEIQKIRRETKSLLTSLELGQHTSTGSYNKLVELTNQLCTITESSAVSISLGIPLHHPANLKIVYSNDIDSARITGRQFPINKGIAGWVFQNSEPYIQNDVARDSKYFNKVDKASGKKTNALMTLPLMKAGRTFGVVQFLKDRGSFFNDDHIRIVSNLLPHLSDLVEELEEDEAENIPVSYSKSKETWGVIVFTDIQGFSKFSEKLSLGVTVTLLNEYYNRLLPFVIDNGGKVQEYIGDGVYVSFLLNTKHESVNAAVKSAIEMNEEYEKLFMSWKQYDHPIESTNYHGIGIASGLLSLSAVGLSWEKRKKLIGNVINQASHLCRYAKRRGNKICICPNTVENLDVRTFQTTKVENDIYELVYK